MPEQNKMNRRCCGKQAGKRRMLSNLENDVTVSTHDARVAATDSAGLAAYGKGLRNGNGSGNGNGNGCGNGKRNGKRNGSRCGVTPQSTQ